MSFMEEFNHQKIKLQDIKLATNNFGCNNLIGHGGFGQVYKGELVLPNGPTMVAFKRLDRKLGQGNIEFYKEISMLSKYKHEHLVSLMHFCIEDDEMILVYEYASRGSLDRYLSDASLTWSQRLKICVGVAHGLNFLHHPTETYQRLIHRDIKSANILLDDKWKAKVSDFGLSKAGPANQMQTFIFSNAVGTPGYCDPLYFETGFLSKESDVYSFGVVLFEVMCGRLCFEYRNGHLTEILVHRWRRCYEENRLDEIILRGLKEQMESGSFSTFSHIAYRCVSKAREERPTMDEVLKELEIALEQQEVYKNLEMKVDIQEMIKIADQAIAPLSYETQEQLFRLFLKGIIVDDGTTWLSLNKNGEICEMISATKCISWGERYASEDSRFSNMMMCSYNGFKVKACTQFLSPNVTYTINLVFKISFEDYEVQKAIGTYVSCTYKLEEETHYLNSSNATMREDGWLVIPLYRFISYQKKYDFNISIFPLLLNWPDTQCSIESIEFRPTDTVTHENLEHNYMEDMQTASASRINWEQKLPNDYTDLIKWSTYSIQWTTKKELYFLLRKGFLIDNGEKWLSISKSMKKRLMIPAMEFLPKEKWIRKSLPESRFKVVAESPDTDEFRIAFKIESKLLSPQTTYSCHLIYKPPASYSLIEGPIALINQSFRYPRSIYLIIPYLTNIRPMFDHKSDKQLNTEKVKGHPKVRKDGWMEVQLWEDKIDSTGNIGMDLSLNGMDIDGDYNFGGLVVQGIELRPL
ncbi:kinase-like domain, phloem protein 2-like protein [Tanacetum coccineum]|uniref:Kinase-like domain, phloem protein 2-like protein n=1 Tax=Tanacetum coccineum TaxID=301880 RepID=A0ABQ5B7H7_9ASTR